MKGIIHDSQTGIIEEFDLSKEEVAERLTVKKLQDATEIDAQNLRDQQSADRAILLNKLGITEDEAKLLLG